MTSQHEQRRKGRPARTAHPLEADPRLRDRVSAQTVAIYGRVFTRIDAAVDQPKDAGMWLRDLIESKAAEARTSGDPGRALAKKSLTVYRGAVAWYLHLTVFPSVDPRQIAKGLPGAGAAGLRDGQERRSLTVEELALYRLRAQSAPEPHRTVLLLLPLTGCRISELCSLERRYVDRATRAITVVGKFGRLRTIELPTNSWWLLSAYLGKHPALGPYAFMIDVGWRGELLPAPRVLTPRDVWNAVQSWEEDREEGGMLHGVCLHQTRHSTATNLVKAGVPLTRVQSILGHKNLTTLARYVHDADAEDRRAALDLLE